MAPAPYLPRNAEVREDHKDEYSYGYESSEKRWAFRRLTATEVTLEPLFPSVASCPGSTAVQTARPHYNSWQNTARYLNQNYPELSPGIELIPVLSNVSETVQKSTTVYDPLTSELISFGRSDVLDQTDERLPEPVDLIAFSSGYSRENVKVSLLRQDEFTWQNASGVDTEPNSTLWRGAGGLIQQILFSEYNDSFGCLLAVRDSFHTSLLKVTCRGERDHPQGVQEEAEQAKSRTVSIDLHVIGRVSALMTGGFIHADIRFRPLEDGQFAIADATGLLTTWRIFGHQDDVNLWRIRPGELALDTTFRRKHKTKIEDDGWGRAVWVCEGNAILFATRSKLCLTPLKVGSRPYNLHASVAGLKAADILDIKRCVMDSTKAWLLTTDELCLLYIHEESVSNGESDGPPKVSVILSIRHHRDPLDHSIHAIVNETATATVILLYSNLAGLCTCYIFGMTGIGHIWSLLADPFILSLCPCRLTEGTTSILRSGPQLPCVMTTSIMGTPGNLDCRQNDGKNPHPPQLLRIACLHYNLGGSCRLLALRRRANIPWPHVEEERKPMDSLPFKRFQGLPEVDIGQLNRKGRPKKQLESRQQNHPKVIRFASWLENKIRTLAEMEQQDKASFADSNCPTAVQTCLARLDSESGIHLIDHSMRRVPLDFRQILELIQLSLRNINAESSYMGNGYEMGYLTKRKIFRIFLAGTQAISNSSSFEEGENLIESLKTGFNEHYRNSKIMGSTQGAFIKYRARTEQAILHVSLALIGIWTWNEDQNSRWYATETKPLPTPANPQEQATSTKRNEASSGKAVQASTSHHSSQNLSTKDLESPTNLYSTLNRLAKFNSPKPTLLTISLANEWTIRSNLHGMSSASSRPAEVERRSPPSRPRKHQIAVRSTKPAKKPGARPGF